MAIRRYKGEEIPESDAIQLLPRQATNGAAMKIAPIGLFNPGNVDQAIYDAAVVTMERMIIIWRFPAEVRWQQRLRKR